MAYYRYKKHISRRTVMAQELQWSSVGKAYKTRLSNLGHALKFNILAAFVVAIAFLVLPAFLGIALFAGHYILTSLTVSLVLVIAGRWYWESLRLAVNEFRA
jgi:hypothetical protein